MAFRRGLYYLKAGAVGSVPAPHTVKHGVDHGSVAYGGAVAKSPQPPETNHTLARFRPAPHNKRMSETLLDVKGMSCPLPVLRANRSLRSMAPGERLRVLATDRAAIADFKAFCQETGHALVAMSEEAGVLSFVIRRRADPPQKDA